jgi:hypothetical protein
MIRFKLSAEDNARLGLDGNVLEFDESRLTVAEHRAVKKSTGMTLADIANGLKSGDLDATAGLVWLTLRRAGHDIAWDALDFDLLGLEWLDEGKADQPATTSTA